METTPEKKGKKRFHNFTEEEKVFMLLHIEKHKDVVDTKDISAYMCSKKKNAWSEITEAFNQEPGNTKRTTQQLQKLYFNIKTRRKKKLENGKKKKSHPIKKSMSDNGDSDSKYDSNDDDFTDEDDDDDMNRTVYEPIIKLESKKRKYNDSLESDIKLLDDLNMKEAEIRLMIANEEFKEAKIRKGTASLVQQYQVKYYEQKIKALNNSGSQFQPPQS